MSLKHNKKKNKKPEDLNITDEMWANFNKRVVEILW